MYENVMESKFLEELKTLLKEDYYMGHLLRAGEESITGGVGDGTDEIFIIPATCTTPGREYFKCGACGRIHDVEIPVTGHKYEEKCIAAYNKGHTVSDTRCPDVVVTEQVNEHSVSYTVTVNSTLNCFADVERTIKLPVKKKMRFKAEILQKGQRKPLVSLAVNRKVKFQSISYDDQMVYDWSLDVDSGTNNIYMRVNSDNSDGYDPMQPLCTLTFYDVVDYGNCTVCGAAPTAD